MKKWLLVLFVLAALFVLSVYIIIPGKLTVSSFALMKANPHGAYRCLAGESTWEKIFGEKSVDNGFEYNKTTFTINRKLLDGIEVLITQNGISCSSAIGLDRLNNDSSIIRWTTTFESSSNPFTKIEQYFAARSIKKNMSYVLDNIKQFLEKEENVYGINVHRTTVKDTLLVAIKSVFKNYPSARDIYSLIGMLQNYARINGARESGYPMLNIKMTDSTNFETMVALPVNKELDDHGAIVHKEMVAGNILVAEVKGGPYTVSKAFNSLGDYAADRDLQTPAIPFQSLITDRLQEPDTAKWITKIYYPIY
jgi:effector-binding domain-containing protein